MGWNHLHVHTEKSPDSSNQVDNLFEEAKRLNFTHLGITDHGTTGAFVKVAKASKKYGVIPVYGVEAYINYDSYVGHLTILAKNKAGFDNVVRLNNASFDNLHGRRAGGGKANCITLEMLQEYNNGLIVLTGCAASPLYQNNFEHGYDFVEKLVGIMGLQNTFAELTFTMPHKKELQQKNTERIVKISDELDIKIAITGDTHYTKQEHQAAHSMVSLIRTGFNYPNDELYVKSEEQMKETALHYISEDAWNTAKNTSKFITDQVEKIDLHNEPVLPPVSVVELQSLIDYLHVSLTHYSATVTEKQSEKAKQRFEYEFSVLERMNFLKYFYFIYRIALFCKENNIPINCRGSAAGSLILYLLQVSYVDPLKYNLYFERFINEERSEYPDVDLDIASERRGEVFDFLYETWGYRQVGSSMTFNHKGFVKEIAKKLNIDDRDLINQAADLEVEDSPEFIQVRNKYPELAEVYDVAIGQERNVGKHAAAVVSLPKDIVVPVENGVIIYDKKDIEYIGGVKIDLLGLSTLSQLELMLQSAKITLPEYFEDYGDGVYKLLKDGKTTGLFQFTSEQGIELLRQIQPDSLLDVSVANAINRPALLQKEYDKIYIANKYGKEIAPEYKDMYDSISKVRNKYEELDEVLSETYGVVLYQEQMMAIYSIMAGGGMASADLARRILSPKSPKARETEEWQTAFASVKNTFMNADTEFDEETRAIMWEVLEQSTGYSFNKAHSASYAAIALMQAYVKYNAPVHFYLSLLRGGSLTLDKLLPTLLSMVRENPEIVIRMPHVNISTLDFDIKDNTIYLPLTLIKGLGESKALKLVALRENNGLFTSIENAEATIPRGILNKNIREVLLRSKFYEGLVDYEAQSKKENARLEYESLGFALPSIGIIKLLDKENSKGNVAGYVTFEQEGMSKNGKALHKVRLTDGGFGYSYPGPNDVVSSVKVGQLISMKMGKYGRVESIIRAA